MREAAHGCRYGRLRAYKGRQVANAAPTRPRPKESVRRPRWVVRLGGALPGPASGPPAAHTRPQPSTVSSRGPNTGRHAACSSHTPQETNAAAQAKCGPAGALNPLTLSNEPPARARCPLRPHGQNDGGG